MPQVLPLVKKLALTLVFLWFFIDAVCHFAIVDPFLRIMPSYVPYPLTMVYISGTFELLGAFGLCIRALRRWAGYGLMLLTICVTPANVHMWLHPDLFPTIPEWVLVFRFPVQLALIYLIWWATREQK